MEKYETGKSKSAMKIKKACRRAAELDPSNPKAGLLEGIAQEELQRTQHQKYKSGVA